MTKTTMKNESGGSVILKESTAGVFRKLTDLGHGQQYNVHSQLNQTYKEYWCIGNGSDGQSLTLSSDDLLEYREILIKPINPSDPTKFNWEGIPRNPGSQTAATTSSSTTTTSSTVTTTSSTVTTPSSTVTTPSSTRPTPSSIWTKFLSNKVLGCFSKQRPPATVVATTTTTTSPGTTNSATTGVTPPATTAPPPPAATTTATTSSTVTITAPLTTTTTTTTTVTPGTNVLATTP